MIQFRKPVEDDSVSLHTLKASDTFTIKGISAVYMVLDIPEVILAHSNVWTRIVRLDTGEVSGQDNTTRVRVVQVKSEVIA